MSVLRTAPGALHACYYSGRKAARGKFSVALSNSFYFFLFFWGQWAEK